MSPSKTALHIFNKASVAITKGGTLLIILGEIALEDTLAVKKIQELGPDVTANIKNLIDFDQTKNTETMQLINDWRTSHGLPPLTPPEPGQ
ncbi:MAG: hypothetical protein DMG65_13585 [Candidatus Angelobacter sp. Gp1-AA117]|nr:MAG: hypothetical protein DMG65_13585 [Candidatus Angelobacter sp. Gp1-AA117]